MITDRTSLNNCYYVSINGNTYYYEDYVKGLQEELEIYLERIDKAIEILKNEDYIDNLPYIDDEVSDKRKLDYWFEVADELDDKRLEALEILGDKE